MGGFLKTACYNYKLRFDEQLLLYAQKPEATAVLPIERWNRTFGRWVNRGAKGIAVFENLNGNSQRLVHYFDISDTHTCENSRAVPIWNMQSEYTDEIIDTLESNFGHLDEKDNLAQAILSASSNAVEDNIPDYVGDLLFTVTDTFLEDLSEDSIKVMYKQLVTNSVAYMLMTRLGIDTEAYFDGEDFRNIINFNTQEALNALGYATSDIAEMGLSEISKTVFALNRQNRIIAESSQTEYTNDTINTERSFDNGRTDLHNAGRLSAPESDTSRTTESGTRILRTDEEKYLLRKHKILYYNLLTRGTLTAHLSEIEQTATEMEERLLTQMAQREGLTEKLKAENPMKWTRLMNNLRHSAQEIVKAEVIYA